MMSAQELTECIRCGKMRVFEKTWKSRPNDRGNVVTHSRSVCPDKECQAIVDEQFAAIRRKKEQTEENRKATVLLKKSKKA